jgi:hypothetical protein
MKTEKVRGDDQAASDPGAGKRGAADDESCDGGRGGLAGRTRGQRQERSYKERRS